MSKYALRVLTIILTLALLAIFTAVPVLAFDARSGDTIAISRGEVVDDDLYVAADTIIIDGTVNGDLWACGRTITVNGVIKGNAMAAGETVNISGDVGHAVRAGGKTINISGNVAGDVMVGCSEVNIASTARIDGDLLLGAGIADILGPIEGDIKGGGGEVTIGNGVKGNVDLEVKSLTMLPTANIEGDLAYTSEEEADLQSGTQIAGAITHNLPKAEQKQAKSFPSVLFSDIGGNVIGFLMALIAGLIIILVMPRWVVSTAEAIRSRPGPSAGWGALVLFATPIAAIIVCITIIGLPVGLIALALWGIAIYLAQIPVGLFIGRWIIGRFRDVEGKAIMVGALALGLVIIKLLRLIPYLDFFIGLAVIIFGLGAVIASGRQQAQARKATSA